MAKRSRSQRSSPELAERKRAANNGILSPMSDSTSPLRALLAAGEWEAADRETRRLLISDADVGGYVGLDPDEAATVDCDLLRSIDVAWTDASDGRFGFTPQANALKVARDSGLPRADTWRAFGRSVGWVDGREWLEGDSIRYETDAPAGHLPWLPGTTTAVNTGRIYEGYFLFYSRFANCPD